MKVIVDVTPQKVYIDEAMQVARKFDIGNPVPEADYRLHFETARVLWSHLSGARLELLDTLHKQGACTVYALAKTAGRNYSNVHKDVAALENLGLIERDKNDCVFVPFDAIEIRMPLAKAA